MVFLGDFSRGVAGEWQSFLGTSVEYAGPVLEDYHGSVNRLNSLKSDLAQAQASGRFTAAQIQEQTSRIQASQAALDRVRSTYSRMSAGASIDDLAQKSFGAYKNLGITAAAVEWIIKGVIAAVIIVSIAYMVYAFRDAVKSISGIFDPDSGDGKDGDGKFPTSAQIAVGVLGLVLLAFLLKE
jgi:hypothetical protein